MAQPMLLYHLAVALAPLLPRMAEDLTCSPVPASLLPAVLADRPESTLAVAWETRYRTSHPGSQHQSGIAGSLRQ